MGIENRRKRHSRPLTICFALAVVNADADGKTVLFSRHHSILFSFVTVGSSHIYIIQIRGHLPELVLIVMLS